jgi:hypothetical protein
MQVDVKKLEHVQFLEQAALKSTGKLPIDIRDRVLTRYRLRLRSKATIGAGNYKPGIKVLVMEVVRDGPQQLQQILVLRQMQIGIFLLVKGILMKMVM